MKGIPSKIYLQVDPDNEKPEFFGELEGITWSVNKINKNDVSYYRKDNNVKPEVKPACVNCKHKDICSQDVLFVLSGWNSRLKKITSCSQFESKSV